MRCGNLRPVWAYISRRMHEDESKREQANGDHMLPDVQGPAALPSRNSRRVIPTHREDLLRRGGGGVQICILNRDHVVSMCDICYRLNNYLLENNYF